MNTTDFLAMQTEYSAKTRGAGKVIDASYPLFKNALQAVLKDFDHPYFGLADFGAADGGTSLSLITRSLDELKSQKPHLPVHLNYSDLPENDFNAVGRMLNNTNGAGDSFLDRYQQLTVSTTPVSFYRPVMPPQTLSLGFSATAMHWLENAPRVIEDHIHIAASKDEAAKETYREMSHEALVKILSRRAVEMHRGAQFLLVNFGINEKGQFLGNTRDVHMFNTFYANWSKMAKEGIITAEEVRNTNFPQYYRSASDYAQAVNDPRLEGKFELVSIDDLTTDCPYREDFEASGDRDTFVKNYPDTLQTWSYNVFYSGLNPSRPVEERHKIVKEFYDRFKSDIAARAEKHGMDYVHHLVLIKRV
ncbi:MAG: hypothetical protein ABR574_10810 [Cryomorphaceae bacterium]|nr:class I SAM-dependent methyltransferase [Flavobacteriales bacterium]